MPRVFISHKKEDSKIAEDVARRVRLNRLDTYVDTIDDTLLKDGPDLADYLLKKMAECQQLIAVVSNNTKTSWWVPWEIGVGSEKNFRMASFSQSQVELPSYLKKWPALHSDWDIDKYCEYSKRTESSLMFNLREAYDEKRRAHIRESSTLDFHKNLMQALR